jgi:hypothetical protein
LWKALAQAITGQETSLEAFDDEEIITQAKQNGVDLLLYLYIKAGTVTGLGEPQSAALKSSVYPQVAHDMMLNEATRNLLDLLAENQVPALLLKGTPLAFLYYPSTYLRARCDTDIYIDEGDMAKAAELLADHNYVLSGLGARKHSSKQFVAAIDSIQNNYLHFDIHWKLSNRVMFRATLPFKDCFENRQPVAALGDNAFALSNTDLLLHACIHRIAHGRNTERDRLLWLYDIHLLVEAMGDGELEGFKNKAGERLVGVLCADAIEVAQELFGTELPEGFLQDLNVNRKNEPSAELIHSSKLRWAWADLRALPGVSKKIAFARELLFG